MFGVTLAKASTERNKNKFTVQKSLQLLFIHLFMKKCLRGRPQSLTASPLTSTAAAIVCMTARRSIAFICVVVIFQTLEVTFLSVVPPASLTVK